MGIDCCRLEKSKNNDKDLASNEEEIVFQQYTSISDKAYKKIEFTYNLLKDFPLSDYLTLLKHFSPQTSTGYNENLDFPETFSSDEPFYSEPMDIDTFQSFIENQLMKHPSIYSHTGNSPLESSAFKESLIEMIRGLKVKLDQYFGSKDSNRIQRGHIIILGLLYCHSRNIAKVKVFFDLFAKEGKLTPSEQLNSFVLSMFILASYSLLSATRNIGNQYHFIGTVPDEELMACLDVAELINSVNLLQIFNLTFFDGKTEMNYDEVKSQFAKNKENFGWMFNTKGIRYMQELNSVHQ